MTGPRTDSNKVLVGILGLQLTLVAGFTELIEQFTSAAEGPRVVLMRLGIAVTASGFFVDRTPPE